MLYICISIYISLYIYMYTLTHTHIYIYMYIERERDRQTYKHRHRYIDIYDTVLPIEHASSARQRVSSECAPNGSRLYRRVPVKSTGS